MLLYWGMFTIGFSIGAVFSLITFAPKKPEDDPEYETPSKKVYALYLPKQTKTQKPTSDNLDVPGEINTQETSLQT